MRNAPNPNYVKFSKRETILSFTQDRGALRKNDGGDYFFRDIMEDRGGSQPENQPERHRYTCANPDLEQCLVNMNYRAGELVGITRLTQDRTVYWKVRRIAPVTAMPAPTAPVVSVPARQATSQRQAPVRSAPQPSVEPEPSIIKQLKPIPPSKYAPPAPVWEDLADKLQTSVEIVQHQGKDAFVTPKKPNGAAADSNGTAAPTPARPGIQEEMKQFLFDAIDLAVDAQKHAAGKGLLFTPGFAEIQDLATSLFIQRSKQSNIDQMDRNQRARANGGADPWRH
jgi:hypothetical protein